jgi:hypothetical protein
MISGGENVGKLNGVFYGIFNSSLTMGTIAVSILVKFNFNLHMLPLVLGFVGLVGVILLCFVE